MTDQILIDAQRIMHEQSRTIEDLLRKVADLTRSLRSARIEAGMRPPPMASSPYLCARAREVATSMGIDFDAVTVRRSTGALSRSPDIVEARGRLILALRERKATPAGPMSYPEIAEVFGVASHTGIRDAERRLRKQRLTAPYGWDRTVAA